MGKEVAEIIAAAPETIHESELRLASEQAERWAKQRAQVHNMMILNARIETVAHF